MDIAELFAEKMSSAHAISRRARYEGVDTAMGSPQTEAIADACWSPVGLKPIDLECLTEAGGVWKVLVGIDRAVGRMLREAHDLMPAHMGSLSARLQDTGILSRDTRSEFGVVLAKGGRYGDLLPLETVDEVFEHVTWCPASVWSRISFIHISDHEDFGFTFAEEDLIIGCVPYIDSLSELTFRTYSEGGRDFYDICPVAPPLIARQRETLVALDEAGCHLGILPESALDDRILASWKDVLLSYPRDSAASRLRWLVVGSGPVDQSDRWPPNRLIVLDRDTGKELIRHDKMAPFTLSPADLPSFGLGFHGVIGPLLERIAEGKCVTVVSTSFGRIVFEICEDLDRVEDYLAILRAVRPRLLLVPVLSAELIETGTRSFWNWETQRGRQHSIKVGCATIVATSLAVPREKYAGQALPVSVVTSVSLPPAFGTRSVAPVRGENFWDPVSVQVHRLPTGWFESFEGGEKPALSEVHRDAASTDMADLLGQSGNRAPSNNHAEVAEAARLLFESDPGAAQRLAIDYLNLPEPDDDVDRKASVLLLLGRIAGEDGHYEEQRERILMACEFTASPRFEADCYLELAIAARMALDMVDASDFLINAGRIYGQLGDSQACARVRHLESEWAQNSG